MFILKILCLVSLLINNFLLFSLCDSPEEWRQKCVKYLSRVPLNNSKRPGSYPFLSVDTYRAICNHFVDETDVPFDSKKVLPGDLIFVNTELIDYFFKNYHDAISSPYILITGNSIMSAPGKFIDKLNNDKLIMWFGVNPSINCHPKFIPLPLGIANIHWPHGNIQSFLDIKKIKIKKKYLLGINFITTTNESERDLAYGYFSELSFCKNFLLKESKRKKPHTEYLRDISECKFVVSPHGAGLDCHRTWEILYAGGFPVVKASTLDSLYEGLPVLIVNSWSDVTEKFLEIKYKEMLGVNYSTERLYALYWINIIKITQRKYREGFNK
jgi:hypothetical protein